MNCVVSPPPHQIIKKKVLKFKYELPRLPQTKRHYFFRCSKQLLAGDFKIRRLPPQTSFLMFIPDSPPKSPFQDKTINDERAQPFLDDENSCKQRSVSERHSDRHGRIPQSQVLIMMLEPVGTCSDVDCLVVASFYFRFTKRTVKLNSCTRCQLVNYSK